MVDRSWRRRENRDLLVFAALVCVDEFVEALGGGPPLQEARVVLKEDDQGAVGRLHVQLTLVANVLKA